MSPANNVATSRVASSVVLIHMNCLAATVTLWRFDGKQATLPMSSLTPEPTSAIAAMTYLPAAPLLHFETVSGDQIVAELPQAWDLAPRRARPIVYLDQNHWSALANAIHAPKKVAAEEREAAGRVIDLALARRIIVPMSAAHMAETCKWTNQVGRYRLALTILQLSAGWQMRDPLDVRRFELRQALTIKFKSRCLLPPPTFTLEPDVVHGTTRRYESAELPSDLAADAAFAVRALRSVSGHLDTMLDAEPVEMGQSPGWVARLQEFTDWLASEPRQPHLRRQRTNLMFLADLRTELAEEADRAQITPTDMSEWTRRFSNGDLGTLPSPGLFREVLHEKLLNPGTRWEDNDLTDMMYLTCAAGYADHVVGENALTAQMERALQRLGRPINVHRHLRDFVGALRL